MTELEMTGHLARAMNGKIGEALRMFLAGMFGSTLNDMLEGGAKTEYNAGRLKGYREITNGLNGMENAFKMMQEQIEKK